MNEYTIKHNPHLDGLRGIAILMVVLYHYGSGFFIFDYGWAGVDLFFVLSGYLLTGRIFSNIVDKKIIWKYYINRALRIVPLYFLTLTVFFFVWFTFASTENIKNAPLYKTHLFEFYAFLTNWIFLTNTSNAYLYLKHLWSLSVEEQFYLTFPIIFLIFKSKKKLLVSGLIIVSIVLFSRCLYFYNLENKSSFLEIYRNTFFRLDSFFWGFNLYMFKESRVYQNINKHIKMIIVFSLLIIISGSFFSGTLRTSAFFATIGFTANAILFASMIVIVEEKKENLLKKITSFKYLQKMGKISYGFYIFHWPMYLFIITLFGYLNKKTNTHINQIQAQIIISLTSFTFSYIISILSFKYFESFFLKWKLYPKQ